VVRDHRLGVAGDDGVDHAQRLRFGVVAERLGEADLARRLAEGLEALRIAANSISDGSIMATSLISIAAILGAQPVAVQCVKRVLAAREQNTQSMG
jgi:hypothetical protein